MDEKVILKQRYQSTASRPGSALEPTISFRHPGYDDPEDILFRLPRLDSLDSCPQTDVAGVHHGTALLACQIIANAFDGYLATNREGTTRVSSAPDGILLGEAYWFIVEGQDVYAVVPRFEEWSFPHEQLHALRWDPIQATADITASATPTIPSLAPPPCRPDQRRCILTNKPYAIQNVHLVPTAQTAWFQSNSMKRYGVDQQFTHNDHNRVPMRHDLHTLWDAYLFALVPKRGSFVVHVLNIPGSAISEFAAEWHNTPVQQGALENTGKAYLFAKFAQAIFTLLKPFVAYSSVSRYVNTLRIRADDPRHPYETKEEWVSAVSLTKMYSGRGSRETSASADGRNSLRSQASSHGDVEEEREWYGIDACGRLCVSDSEDDVERGRPRKRRQRC